MPEPELEPKQIVSAPQHGAALKKFFNDRLERLQIF
jgi:hypothetical protein